MMIKGRNLLQGLIIGALTGLIIGLPDGIAGAIYSLSASSEKLANNPLILRYCIIFSIWNVIAWVIKGSIIGIMLGAGNLFFCQWRASVAGGIIGLLTFPMFPFFIWLHGSIITYLILSIIISTGLANIISFIKRTYYC